MHLEVITPDSKLYEGEVKLVQVPGSKGSFEMLQKHAPIISTLEKGKIKIVDEAGVESFIDIKGGVVETKENKIIILAEL